MPEQKNNCEQILDLAKKHCPAIAAMTADLLGLIETYHTPNRFASLTGTIEIGESAFGESIRVYLNKTSVMFGFGPTQNDCSYIDHKELMRLKSENTDKFIEKIAHLVDNAIKKHFGVYKVPSISKSLLPQHSNPKSSYGIL